MRTLLYTLAFLHLAVLASAQYDLSWGVIAGGGVSSSTGSSFQLGATLAQPVALGANPSHTAGAYHLTSGFWYVRYATLSGIVHLQQFGGDPSLVPVELQVRVPGSLLPLQVHPLTLNASGGYGLVAPLEGVYDLSVKASHWLRQTLPSVTVRLSASADFSLLNGDVDGDNEVTLFDFGALVSAFGSMPGDSNWNANADLDGDEEVTLFDFGVLVSNFGMIGDD